ncbi:E3 ubiquitin-protein ligase TRIM11-like [Rana temporaria]|uniref:E3 ubiquitin-protein ligase TRIM11-like n=1 Tax=Rana temporaria TaxID=8407 RepID=UPI001AACCEE8|nr:E3 ubiquitin-protein ligase TRIM11-like [Rana temporaria]
MTHFIPVKGVPSAEQTSKLMVREVCKLHGIPDDVMPDRGVQLTSEFWNRFCSALGVKPAITSSHLECSVCLNIYKDPVTLKRGHNFCRDCIGSAPDIQEEDIPVLNFKQNFKKRPVLQRNLKLSNLMENIQSTRPDQEESGVFCTYCIHTPVPAVISCLHCEASLCDDDLRVHSKLDGELRGHQVETLDEASEKKKKILKNVQKKLRISNKELPRKTEDIEELCNKMDPLTILKESDTGDLCDSEDGDDEELDTGDSFDSEDGDDEDRERRDNLLHDGGDLDVAGTSHTLHTGLSDIMSGGNVEKCTGTHVYPRLKRKGEDENNAEQSRKRPKLSPIDILLDVSTAGKNLHISDDRTTVSRSDVSQNYPETPERFQDPQVISSEGISSGRHYWEVDVGGSRVWKVGICYPSIDRRGHRSVIGHNKKSWCLERKIILGGSQYSAIHDSKVTKLLIDVSSKRVRIDLDYEAGQISFYDLCDPIRHLYTFTTTFTEPLHAGIYLGLGSCIMISGGNQM